MQPVEEQERARHATAAGAGAGSTPPKQARTGLVLLTVLVVEVVVIGAGLNQVVAKHIANTAASHTGAVRGGWESLLTYRWRFTPLSGDHQHIWAGELALIGTTIVMSLLLVFAVVRGAVTWGRAFFGAWLAVAVATLLGGYVCALIVDPGGSVGRHLADRTLFGPVAPGTRTILAGLALGLVVAIVASIVAIATRCAPAAAEGPADGPAESIFTAGQGEWNSPPPPPSAGWPAGGWAAEQPPPNPPPWGQDAQHTSRLPSTSKQDVAYDSSSGPQTKAAPAGAAERGPDQPTTVLPVPDPAPNEEQMHAAGPPAAAEPQSQPPVEQSPVERSAEPEPTVGEHAAEPEPTVGEHAAEPEPTVGEHAAEPEPEPTQAMPAQGTPPQQQPQQRHGATAFPRPPDDEDLQSPHEQG
ncbi:hypothetical protein [uncultured Jatrophihabitans sp.]|uniref:hypothetical protein n=1 Tax=uncultured Jatrophihabitans sp. TaxID=1610747 RepID=UPI0035CBE91F